MEESIYSLLPQRYKAAQRPQMHKSKMGEQPLAYSTFPTKDGVSDGTGSALFKRRTAPIGAVVSETINPKNFTVSHSGFGGGALKKSTSASARRTTSPEMKKPAVPKRDDKPVYGLKTEKDFVHSNAVDAICKASKRPQLEPVRHTLKKDFGQVPAYLTKVKAQRESDTKMIHMIDQRNEADQQAAMEEYVREVGEHEKEELRAKLKERWDALHQQYQSLPFARDTAMQIARKEKLEEGLKEIEKALEKLGRKVLYVYNDQSSSAHWAKDMAMTKAQNQALHAL